MIFNEKEFGKFLYEHQADTILPPKTYSVWELTILAKYLRQELKKSEKEIKNGIIKFCNLNYPGFDSDVEYEKINKVMIECYKTDLRKCTPVPITKSEWENIQKCSTEKIQKLLFAILAISKFNRLNPVEYLEQEEETATYEDTRLRCNETETNLYKLMKITFSDCKDKFQPYGELGKQGLNLIEAVNSNKVKRILNFGELNPKEEDILIQIEDFDNLPDYFLALQENKRIKICEDCKKVFIDKSKNKLQRKCHNCKKSEKINSHERKFCIDCGEEIRSKYINQEKIQRCEECQKKYNGKMAKMIEKECENCHSFFLISSKSSRNLCDECYKEYRRKNKTEAMRKLRNKGN